MSLKTWLLANLRDKSPAEAPEPVEPEGEKTAFTPDGYPLVQFSPDITNVLRFDGVGFNYAQIYASQQNVRTVIDYIARQGAGLRLKHYEKVGTKSSLPSDRVELDDSDLANLLEDPTPGESRFDFYYAAFADFCIYDENKYILVRDRPGAPPRALVRVPPPNLIPERENITNRVIGWRSVSGIPVPFEDVLWFTGYDPNTSQSAISPMETLRRLLAEEFARDKAQEAFWRRGLRKDGVIEIESGARKMPDEARESFLVDAEDAMAGSNGYRPFMLEPGMKWVDTSWKPNDTQYILARRVSRQEACAMWHVPPALVAAAENGAQPDEQSLRVFHQSSLPPYLERFEANVKAKLLPLFTPSEKVRRQQYVRFNLDEKLRGSFEEKAAIMATVVGGPVASVNEGRARLDLPATDNPADNEIYVPLNSMRAGGPQVSPQNPTATPATGVEPAGTTPTPGPKDAAEVVRDFDERIRVEHEKSAKIARIEARIERAITKHFSRQQKVSGKRYDEERWTRELVEDLTSELLAYDLAAKAGPVQVILHEHAVDINADTELGRENGAFEAERASSIAVDLAECVLDALEHEGKTPGEGQ